MTVSEISAQDFKETLAKTPGATVLDVRTPIECKSQKLSVKCLHVALQDLDADAFAKTHKDQIGKGPLYILCQGGVRARQAAEKLSQYIDNVVVVSGGLNACTACGIETKKEETISLERQVRIAAGTLVLAGVLLGHFVTPDFYILSGFVGAGLILSGITGWCGMAMLIARAPWNR